MSVEANAAAGDAEELAFSTEPRSSFAPSGSLKGLNQVLSMVFSLPHLPLLFWPLPPLLLLLITLEAFRFCVAHASLAIDEYCNPSPPPPAEFSDPLLRVRAAIPLLRWSSALSNKNLALPRECTRTNFCPPDPYCREETRCCCS